MTTTPKDDDAEACCEHGLSVFEPWNCLDCNPLVTSLVVGEVCERCGEKVRENWSGIGCPNGCTWECL